DQRAGGHRVFLLERSTVHRPRPGAAHAYLTVGPGVDLDLRPAHRHRHVRVLAVPDQDAPVATAVLQQQDLVRAADLEAPVHAQQCGQRAPAGQAVAELQVTAETDLVAVALAVLAHRLAVDRDRPAF